MSLLPPNTAPFYHYLDVTAGHCNLVTKRIATWENLLLPKILAYYNTSTKLRDILSMQLDCFTAESEPLFSAVYIVPNAVSLSPALTFLFLSTFYSLYFCSISPLGDSFCVLTPLKSPSSPTCLCSFVSCALPLLLLCPVSSSHGQRCLGHAATRSYAL